MKEKGIVICWIMFLLLGLSLAAYPVLAADSTKKFIVAVGQEPSSMDPTLTYLGADNLVVENWGEYPIQRMPNGDLAPGLATSWKVSPDAREIEFTVRKGVKFHSGDPLTAKDFEFSFQRARAKSATHATRLKSIERFEIIDDYHYKLHFKTQDILFLPNRAGGPVVSKSYYDRVGEDNFVKTPAATGPYKVVRLLPGEYVDIERFDDYWGEKPPVKEARFYFVSEDMTRVSKLKAGEVDMITQCPYPSFKDVENTPGLKTIKLAVGHPSTGVIFSNRNPKTPWHDRRVRLAMAYAIDWKTIVKDILLEIPNHYAYLAPHELGYDPNLKPYPYDPKKAKELLSEAGYPKGFDLKLYWVITSRVPMSREVSEAIAAYLEAVGIRTKLIGEEAVAATSRLRAANKPNAEYVCYYTMHGRSGAPDPIFLLDMYYKGDGTLSVYSNPELDKIIVEARTTGNDAKRGELIKKATWMINEDVATVPIFNNVALFAMRQNIDFKPTQKYMIELLLVKDITIR